MDLSTLLYVQTIFLSPSPVPAGPPENVTATANTSTTITVKWDEVLPIDQNGVITMYEVMYTPLEDFGGTVLANTTIISEQSTVLQNLQEYVNYSISVRAFTGIGMGPFSAPLMVLTLEDGEIYFLIL